MSRVEVIQAEQDGKGAGERGDRPSVCPHPRGSLLRRAWFRGYAEARPFTEPDDDA